MSNFLKYLKEENNDVVSEETILNSIKPEWDQYCIDAPTIATASTATNDVKVSSREIFVIRRNMKF
jgi:hypothetical protein